MPNQYIENSERWKALSHIDYFTQFVKAWIPFNAWYKNSYQNLEHDGEIIEAIKTESNKFRNKIVSLLDGEENENRIFKNHIADLHYQLERNHVFNKKERICFAEIVIEQNKDTIKEFSRRGITFKAERNPSNWKNIKLCILNKSKTLIFNYEQQNGYNIDEMKKSSEFQGLFIEYQKNIEFCYKAINPYKPISLLVSTPTTDSIKIGTYDFMNDKGKIAKGIIIILYLLRNALFHGEIIPDRQTQKVYEPAYHVLNQLIETL